MLRQAQHERRYLSHKQTRRHLETQTLRLRHLGMQTCRHADMQTCRHADMQTCRHADMQTCTLLDTYRDINADMQPTRTTSDTAEFGQEPTIIPTYQLRSP
jgi:hypothetical protein